MGLIYQADYITTRNGKVLIAAELVHDADNHTAVTIAVTQEVDKVSLALRHTARLGVGLNKLLYHLVLQLVPVNNNEYRGLLQFSVMPKFLCGKENG